MKATVIAIYLLVFALAIYASEGVYIHNGFSTGEEYLAMDYQQKRAFAMGTVNGMLLAPLFGAPKPKMLWLEKCVVEMTDYQVATILTKYLEDNPGRWHQTPHAPMYAALKKLCPKP